MSPLGAKSPATSHRFLGDQRMSQHCWCSLWEVHLAQHLLATISEISREQEWPSFQPGWATKAAVSENLHSTGVQRWWVVVATGVFFCSKLDSWEKPHRVVWTPPHETPQGCSEGSSQTPLRGASCLAEDGDEPMCWWGCKKENPCVCHIEAPGNTPHGRPQCLHMTAVTLSPLGKCSQQ